MRRNTYFLIGGVLLCAAIFAAGQMVDSGIKWVAIPLAIVLFVLLGG